MSVTINLYVEDISDDIIPLWLQGLDSCGMKCEIHPKFSFSDHSGFLPFKVEFRRKELPKLNGKTLLSGFELYVDPFDFTEVEDDFRELESFTPEVRRRLIVARKYVWFRLGSRSLEAILADFSCGILAKLLDGTMFEPEGAEFYSNDGIIERIEKETFGEPRLITAEDDEIIPFTGWGV